LKASLKQAYFHYDRFMEKQGFTVVLLVCILIILLSALYTFHFREEWMEEAVLLPADVTAGGNQSAQSLKEAQELISSQERLQTLVPQKNILQFSQPVAGFLDRDFSMEEPQFFPQANYWRLHPGIDLQAEYGTPVQACADGKVLKVWEDNERGLCICIEHEMSYRSIYAGLSDASYVRAGDPVVRSQTIGHVGNGVLAESDASAHLHFEVWQDTTVMDPVELFLGIEK